MASDPASTNLPATVLALLRRYVTSHEQVEILLALRACSGAPMTVPALATVIHGTSDLVRESLPALAAAGMLEAQGEQIVYAPRTRRLASMVDALAQVRAEQPLELLSALNRNAVDRIRADAARAFADAFVVGKRSGKKTDDG